MKRERWPVIDTHLHVGVNPTTTFIAEEELIPYLDENGIDILADLELLRLAFPRRVFTLSQTMFVLDRIKWLYDNRELVGGLRFVEEPPVLRFFNGRLEPTSNRTEKLVEKFNKDFGGSL